MLAFATSYLMYAHLVSHNYETHRFRINELSLVVLIYATWMKGWAMFVIKNLFEGRNLNLGVNR